MILTRKWSVFLALAGLFNVVVWPRFAVAIWNDPRAFSGPDAMTPTAFLMVHAVLIVSAFFIGLLVLGLGLRALAVARRTRSLPSAALSSTLSP
ncbi:hypothetical protein EH165_07760 [Nakamurella antarctica]|uniref:Uncharacterized protein n=1 Tax=Nakamurella antarctica TaxID=1902245 RepID=A0A3G8ZLC2_9ACTN|nr:hypothetical protein [Nakamurella antarctica]AZI58053.1 hypothetical protein EH165_07760 [Nakamurella antarctica]